MGDLHSTKHFGLKFRVFLAKNGTVFSGCLEYSLRRMEQYFLVGWTNPSHSKFRAKIEELKGELFTVFTIFLLALGMLDVL